MKYMFLLLISIVLCGCFQDPRFYPFEGNISVKGDGGFVEDYISSDDIVSKGLFADTPDYKYDGVKFFLSGLPENENCILYGYMSSTRDNSYENRRALAKQILEMDANVATMSSVSAPIQLNNGKGTLGNGLSGHSSHNYNGYGQVASISEGYNIFECK